VSNGGMTDECDHIEWWNDWRMRSHWMVEWPTNAIVSNGGTIDECDHVEWWNDWRMRSWWMVKRPTNAIVSYSRYYSRNCLPGLRKITKIIGKSSKYCNRNPIPAPPDTSTDCYRYTNVLGVWSLSGGSIIELRSVVWDEDGPQREFCTGCSVFLHTQNVLPPLTVLFLFKIRFLYSLWRSGFPSFPTQVFPEWCGGWSGAKLHLADS
jgi:hypothetical protein